MNKRDDYECLAIMDTTIQRNKDLSHVIFAGKLKLIEAIIMMSQDIGTLV